ncbi:MAG TPA: Crp/Fnr family transcriptional regulator [Cyclobacteriaceae bacterium]|nr:Crp/Fnr family transcriptional regulator [Cyclobacteriaceae bacterium]HRJ80663.1 Crp/Fnr family transcriptional regulator [Cyclobacteriaceae bacterium]
MDEFASIRKFVSQFVTFTEEEWRAHQSALTRKWFKKGEFLLTEGQVCNHVSFVNRGCFRNYNMVRDEERTQFFVFENEYATDYCSFVTRLPSRDFIVALEDAEVLQLEYTAMHFLYEKYGIWQKYGRLIAEYVFVFTAFRSQNLLLKTPEELYLQLMQEKPLVLERVPLKYIASFLGVTPEALSRIRKRVAQSGAN